ncbi:MAG TPA: ATP-binding protein [Lachnospiraceae bacterium]|jgi:ABC-type Mn2+/Zn2+ transport system ATPase subunit|nr:ATP-binding protein [Lachnospiraceae bacterium]
MVVMDLRIHNFFAFTHFHLNLSYPRKIAHSPVPNEHLPGRDNFRYRKAVIILGPNASGKTTLGRILTGIIKQMRQKDLSPLRRMIADPASEASFSIEFVPDESVLYRVTARFLPLQDGDDPDSGILVSVKHTMIGKKDSYETCVKRLDQKGAEKATDIVDELGNIFGLNRTFVCFCDTPVRFDSDERLHVLEAVLKVLDPSILSVTRLPQVENSYLISYPHRRVILQEGQVADRDQLSGGTLDGICVAGMLADILCRKGGLYYCDEMFSHIGSDVEKAVLSVMVDHLGDYEQLFFTTRNADILTMPFPRHTFVFLKKEPCDTGAILSLGASLQS